MKKTYLALIILFFIAVFPFLTSAQENLLELEIKTEKTEVKIGGDFNVTLLIKQASTQNQINLQDIPISGLEQFEQISKISSTNIKIINGKTALIQEQTKTLVAQNSGDFVIGPVKIMLSTASGDNRVIESNSILIKVVPESKAQALSVKNTSEPTVQKNDLPIKPAKKKIC